MLLKFNRGFETCAVHDAAVPHQVRDRISISICMFLFVAREQSLVRIPSPHCWSLEFVALNVATIERLIQNPSMFVRRRCAYDARLPYSFTEFNRVLNSNMFDSDASVSILAQSVGVFDRDPCAPRVAAVPCPISCTQYLCLFVLLEDELQDCPCACIERLFVCALDPKFFDTHLPHSFTALLLSSVCETMSSLPND